MASSLFSFLSPRPSFPPLALPGRTGPGPVHVPTTPNGSSSSFLSSRHHFFLSPLTTTSPIRPATAVAAAPLISPHDQWGTWTALFATGAFGIWSEKTKLGSALSGALVSTLVGLAASSTGIIASDAPAYKVVLEYLLPMAVPLLLFNADLRRVLRSTGTLLLAFLVGSESDRHRIELELRKMRSPSMTYKIKFRPESMVVALAGSFDDQVSSSDQ